MRRAGKEDTRLGLTPAFSCCLSVRMVAVALIVWMTPQGLP